MPAFIDPPPHIPWYLRIGIWIAERTAQRELLPARLLAWYPKAAIGSGALEALVAHREPGLDERLLQLVRLQASYALACPFCIDMNSHEHEQRGITPAELAAVQNPAAEALAGEFPARERAALEYARLISRTPLAFPPDSIETLKAHFSAREIVILASTAAQVNYWARLIQALGIPPAGYSEACARPANETRAAP